MSNLIQKKPYEISLWEDIIVFVVDDNGKKIEYEEKIPSTAQGLVIAQYYKERKVCVIGSNTMDSPIRVVKPKIVSNVNGSNTLTFTLYLNYYDEYNNKIENPFIGLLKNESKIKVKYDNKWYDFVIKNISEKSESRTIEYTCKDLFINELSKSGFELVLDAELENNMGTITELADYVLADSDWQVDKTNGANSILRQYKEQPLYIYTLNFSTLSAKNMLTNESIVLKEGDVIYVFYDVVENEKTDFQFLYVKDGKYEANSERIITNSPNYCGTVDWSNINKEAFILSEEYRGKSLVSQPQVKYDSKIDKYVKVYENGSIYGFTENEYITSTTVKNYVSNPSDFQNTSGWYSNVGTTISPYGYPDIKELISLDGVNFHSFLKVQGNMVVNTGISNHANSIDSFTEGEEYIFRIKYAQEFDDTNKKPKYASKKPTAIEVATYNLVDGAYIKNESIFKENSEEAVFTETDDNQATYVYVPMQCIQSLSHEQILKANNTNGIGIFITLEDGENYIEEVQFFPYQEKENGAICLPGEAIEAYAKTRYKYYMAGRFESYNEIQYLYDGYEEQKYRPVYTSDDGFEKIRSVTAKESNHFNIIQDLCEIFECWARFEIEHEETGEIKLDDNYRQRKFVSFKEFIGKDNYAGFKYGINLKNITRSLDSDAIVSKIIVKNNANEFAKDGFCSIARADESENGENFILDFNYYYQQGLLNFNTVNNDLYLTSNGYLGYYKELKSYNQQSFSIIDEYTELSSDKMTQEADCQTYSQLLDSSEEELASQLGYVYETTGLTFNEMMSNKDNDWWNNDSVSASMEDIARLKANITRFIVLKENAENNLNNTQTKITELENRLEEIREAKKILNEKFYQKYSRFIQEGSWISEDYVDDNLYYLDARSTLRTSSQPKVSYTINVLEISQIPGYENYKFDLGDKTYIEDTEFFGWVWNGEIKTPYQEEIIVSETAINLDSPEENIIKVQNYKTQFEDLFQRITATTQNIEFSTGEYTRATKVVETNGTISNEVLQNSMTHNALVLQNARDQSVIWDETGITTSSLARPNELVRLVSGGLFLSNDGGVTWNTGITGSGINANYLKTGRIDTSIINIMNGATPTFKWDKYGINAYQFSETEDGGIKNYSPANFVRLDQYGLYGIKGHANYVPKSLQDVINTADFSLTWDGFSLKSSSGEGYIKISSKDDFQVINKDGNEAIKIGRLIRENGEPSYGLRISNNGLVVMETEDDGSLWLKNELKIGLENKSTVSIGMLGKDSEDDKRGSRVFDANDKFVVYEDGSMRATNGYFEGEIHATSGTFKGTVTATGGTIGGLTVEQITNSATKFEIKAEKGLIFKINKDGIVSPSDLILEINSTLDAGEAKWYISKDFISWTILPQIGSTITLSYQNIQNQFENGTCFIRTELITDEKTYSEYCSLQLVSDGAPGAQGPAGKDGKDGKDGEDALGYLVRSNIKDILLAYSDVTSSFDVLTPSLVFELYTTDDSILLTDNYEFSIKFLYEFAWEKIDSGDLLSGNVLVETDDKKQYILYLNKLLEGFGTGDSSESNELLKKFQSLFEGNGSFVIFDFKTKDTETTCAQFLSNINFATTQNLARLSINADLITQAIANTKLEFGAAGLTIRNGGFKIWGIDQAEPIFSISADEKTLEMKGSGTFTGDIYADSGYFKGDISGATGTFTGALKVGEIFEVDNTGKLTAKQGHFEGEIVAKTGEIGGFKISENSISANGLTLYSAKYDEDNNIISPSYVIVDNIELGTGATIKNYIEFKNANNVTTARIMNPSINNGEFIQANDLIIKETGEMYGTGWSISNQGAEFENAHIRGKISSSVFTTEATQAISSAVVFRPSAKISLIQQEGKYLIIFPENDISFLKTGISWLRIFKDKDVGVNIKVEVSAEGKIEIINGTEELYENYKENSTVILLSEQNGDNLTNNVIISVNSSPNGNLMGAPGYGLSFAKMEFDESKEKIEFSSPLLFLGDLSKIPISETINAFEKKYLNGYGLYCENVYLNGSLTTKIPFDSEAPTYAGINTMNTSLQKGEENIVFWAGAKTLNDIDTAPFIVTDQGNLYAEKGQFNGALITNSDIIGATLRAAEIYGWNTEKNEMAPLSIFDTNKGIEFKKHEDPKDLSSSIITTLIISDTGFKTSNTQFIAISDNIVNGKFTKIEADEIFGTIIPTQIKLGDTIIMDSEGNWNFNSLELKSLISDDITVNKNFNLGTMKYTQVSNGYNLYIS